MYSSYHQPSPRTPTSASAHRTSHAWRRQGGAPGILEIYGCQKCSRHHLMNPRTFFSCSFDIELANARLLSKAVCMRHGDTNDIKVRVLEATQTAEPILYILPILPVSSCVSKHSESHLALKDAEGNHALIGPVPGSWFCPLRLS